MNMNNALTQFMLRNQSTAQPPVQGEAPPPTGFPVPGVQPGAAQGGLQPAMGNGQGPQFGQMVREHQLRRRQLWQNRAQRAPLWQNWQERFPEAFQNWQEKNPEMYQRWQQWQQQRAQRPDMFAGGSATFNEGEGRQFLPLRPQEPGQQQNFGPIPMSGPLDPNMMRDRVKSLLGNAPRRP